MNIRFIFVVCGMVFAVACGKSDSSSADSETGGSAGQPSKAGSVSATGGTAGSSTAGGSSSSAGINGSAGRAGHGGMHAAAGEGGEVGVAGAPGAAGAATAGASGAGGEAGQRPVACLALATSCEFSSECCSNYCKTETHECVAPERCPRACAVGTYCVPNFEGAQNTCAPAPTPKCQGDLPMSKCNRCVVKNCPAETVYCGCTDECFGSNGGCLPTCGPSFAGFNECMAARCQNECWL